MAEIVFQRTENDTSPDAWAKLGAMQRASQARGIFSQNLDEKGRLNEAAFYKGIADAGLGMEDAKTAMDWNAAGKDADVNTAVANMRLEAMGYDPAVSGRNAASMGEPPPVEVPNPDLQPAATAPQKTALETWWETLRGKPTAPPEDAAAQVQAQTAPPSGGAQLQGAQSVADMGNLGSSSLATAQLPPLPEGAGASPTVLRPGQDARTARQLVEDSYNPANTMAARMAARMGSAQQPTATPDLFDWKPVDNGSNQFQQFSQALGAKLRGIGALDAQGNPDPSKYLQQVYSSTVMSNMPPAPNPALLNQGLEGMTKYEGEVQAYQAALTKAKGLGEAAVLKAKTDLVEYAKQFGVDTVEQRRSEIPGGMLRDPAKRTEAAALITNQQNIANASHAVESSVDASGPNVSKLMLAAPQVIRAYATALNPGQQLSEGNLLEVAGQMYKELSGPKLIQMAAALGRGIRNNDWSGFKTLADAVDATAPQALYQRMRTLAQEAAKLNQTSLASYVEQPGGKPTPAKLTKETLGEALGIKGKAGTRQAPIDLSTGVEPAIGQYYIHKGKVMRRDK